MADNENKEMGAFFGIVTGLAGAFGVWAFIAFLSGLASVDFNVAEMGRQYLIATGNLNEYETMVDFYTHIKGVEYLLAGLFFLAFPFYFKYLERSEKVRG
jgi:hypothetical protein